MAKVISNLTGVEQFIINENDTTNLDKQWETWKEDFELYFNITGVMHKKGITIALSREKCKRNMQNS